MFSYLGPIQRELYFHLQSHIYTSPPIPIAMEYLPDDPLVDDENEPTFGRWAHQVHGFYEAIALAITAANGGPSESPFSIVYLRKTRTFVIYPNLRIFDIPIACATTPVEP